MADRRSNLESVIKTAIDSALKEVHTCLPAVVTAVDATNQLVDAQIVIKRKMGGKVILLPPLVKVPIRFPRSKTFSITFPIEVGDHVKITFCERSIDNWLLNGGQVDPLDYRRFSLSDAFAEPWMYPQTDLIPDFDNTNLEIKTNSGNTKIIVKSSEDVEVITTGEVKADCDTLLADVSDSATINCDTAEVNATTSVDINTPIVTITGNLDVTGTITAPIITSTSGSGTITATNMVANTSLTVVGKEMDQHVHPQGADSNGDTQQNTGPPV